MENHIKSTPKDVFLHLFNIVTFYLSVIGFITLFIQYINASFPDSLDYYFMNIANGVRWSSSVLLIAFPAYLLTTWFLEKDLISIPAKRDLKLRKWLTYFTLFVSAITIIIDLMTFVYNFLNGELSTRFFLKVLVVLVVAGAVFGYYLWDLKREEQKTKVLRILAIVSGVLVLGSVVLGFFIVGTPSEQRNRRFDDQRLNDLQVMQSQVVDYWTKKNALPTKLADLQDNISGFMVPTDPNTQIAYEYNIISPLSFNLCANFAGSNLTDSLVNREPTYYSPYDNYQQNWSHDKGRVCFERTIDPELYKNTPAVPTKF